MRLDHERERMNYGPAVPLEVLAHSDDLDAHLAPAAARQHEETGAEHLERPHDPGDYLAGPPRQRRAIARNTKTPSPKSIGAWDDAPDDAL